MTTSALLIIPAPLRAAANAVGDAMGWGPENYTVPLSSDGSTVTHYACRTDVQPTFLVILLAAGYDLTRAGLTPDQIAGVQAALDAMPEPPVIPPQAAAVLGALDIDLSDTLWGADHAHAAMDARGLAIAQ